MSADTATGMPVDVMRRRRRELGQEIEELTGLIERAEELERVARLAPGQRRLRFRVIQGGAA